MASGSIKFQLQNKFWPPIEIVSSDNLISSLPKKNSDEKTESYRIAIRTCNLPFKGKFTLTDHKWQNYQSQLKFDNRI